MGLPLFVAPVKSDLSQKSPHKTASSPPRTNIRRAAQISSARERASLNRRTRTLEHHEQQRHPLPGIGEVMDEVAGGVAGEVVGQIRAGIPAPNSASARPSEMARVARYITNGFATLEDFEHNDPERRQRRLALMENMASRFGPGWQNRDWEQPQQDTSSDWWIVEPRLDSGSARLTRLVDHNFDFSRSRTRPRHIEIVPSITWSSPRQNSNRSPLPSRHSRQERPAPRRPMPSDTDGLGDRERSLSPEGWDTLLTTLTPDPQPPSASSSFVSTAASHAAGDSSNTSLSENLRGADPALEPPCESGCENSDTEEAETSRRRRRLATRTLHRSSRRAQPIEPPVRWRPSPSPEHNPAPLLPVLPLTAYAHRHTPPLSQSRVGGPGGLASQLTMRRRLDPWVGQLSVGISDDEQASDRPRQNPEAPEAPAASGNHVGSGEEQPTSIRRLLMGLVHEDIPDETWARLASFSRAQSRESTD